MTTPTRKQVVQWALAAGWAVEPHTKQVFVTDGGVEIQCTSGLKEFAAIARADLEATIAEQAKEIQKLKRLDFRDMREMLRAMQAGELTVSRGIEILDIWHAGNWNNDMLPPVQQDLIEEDSMPIEIIDRLRQQLQASYEQGKRDGRQQIMLSLMA